MWRQSSALLILLISSIQRYHTRVEYVCHVYSTTDMLQFLVQVVREWRQQRRGGEVGWSGPHSVGCQRFHGRAFRSARGEEHHSITPFQPLSYVNSLKLGVWAVSQLLCVNLTHAERFYIVLCCGSALLSSLSCAWGHPQMRPPHWLRVPWRFVGKPWRCMRPSRVCNGKQHAWFGTWQCATLKTGELARSSRQFLCTFLN